MANSFGNDKSFMITDYAEGGPLHVSDNEFSQFKQQQREKGCTCRWQIHNGTDYERRENPVWDECPIHGL